MARRKFNIEVYKWSQDWFIELDGVEDFEDFPYFGGTTEYGFAKSRSTKDMKIAYLFSNTMRNEDIELAKEDEKFQEVCDFKIRKIYKDADNEHSEFTASFSEALEYIQEALNDE